MFTKLDYMKRVIILFLLISYLELRQQSMNVSLLEILKKNDLQGFQWKAAFELEFFVIESQKENEETIKIPDSLNAETSEGQLYSIGSLELCRKWLEEIVENCLSMGVPADTFFLTRPGIARRHPQSSPKASPRRPNAAPGGPKCSPR